MVDCKKESELKSELVRKDERVCFLESENYSNSGKRPLFVIVPSQTTTILLVFSLRFVNVLRRE